MANLGRSITGPIARFLAPGLTTAPPPSTIAGMSGREKSDDWPTFCNRCSKELTPGTGDFYVVRIEAVADPTPPEFSEEDLQRDPRAELDELLEQLRDVSEREAMDQVYRRVTIHLCTPCYRKWIENPTG